MRWVTGLILIVICVPVSADHYARCAPAGVALGGYDVVSYFSEAGPLPGSTEHTATVAGLTYHFVNADNLARFAAQPESFLPTYRGWCAATLAMGRLACPDFANYKIEDGQLLLFELAGFTNGRDVWNSDPAGHRARADANARQLLHE